MCGSSAVISRAGMQHGVCCHRHRDRRSGAIHIRTQLSAGSTGNSRTNWTMWSGRILFSAVVSFQKANRHFWQVFKWWVKMGDDGWCLWSGQFYTFWWWWRGTVCHTGLANSLLRPLHIGSCISRCFSHRQIRCVLGVSAFLFAMSNVAVNTDTNLLTIQFTQSCQTDAADMNDLGPCCWPFDPARRVTENYYFEKWFNKTF